MRAVWLREFGPPSALSPGEAPEPGGEAVIDVAYANITFVETQVRAGRAPLPVHLPLIPGTLLVQLAATLLVVQGEYLSGNAPATHPANLAARAGVTRHMTITKRIVAAAIALLTLLPLASAQASSPPPITPLKPLEVKWILPPKTSPFYESEKANAEAAGYETVEHDDLSYPGPRA